MRINLSTEEDSICNLMRQAGRAFERQIRLAAIPEEGEGNGCRFPAETAEIVKRNPELDPWRHEELATSVAVTSDGWEGLSR